MITLRYWVDDVAIEGFFPLRNIDRDWRDVDNGLVRIILQIEDSYEIWVTDMIEPGASDERIEEVMAHFVAVLLACEYIEHPDHLISWQVLEFRMGGC